MAKGAVTVSNAESTTVLSLNFNLLLIFARLGDGKQILWSLERGVLQSQSGQEYGEESKGLLQTGLGTGAGCWMVGAGACRLALGGVSTDSSFSQGSEFVTVRSREYVRAIGMDLVAGG